MKKFIFPFLLSLLYAANTMACLNPEAPNITTGGIRYAYDRGMVWVCGIETKQDSVVIPSHVRINGKKFKIETIEIADSSPTKVLVIPSSVTDIIGIHLSNLEKLYISQNVQTLHDICTTEYAAISSQNLKEIIVDKRNKNFCSIDGILYSKDKSALYLYPTKKRGKEFTIPSQVQTIYMEAFKECHLEKIYYPKGKNILSYSQWSTNDMQHLREFTLGIDDNVELIPK